MRCFLAILVSITLMQCNGYRNIFNRVRRPHCGVCSMTVDTSMTLTQNPLPGSPIVRNIITDKNIAQMTITLNGELVAKAFSKTCDLFNEEVAKKKITVRGFRPGSALPPPFLFSIFGKNEVILFCVKLLQEEIQDECEKTGLLFLGRGRITNFFVENFEAGKPHTLELECDLVPQITYTGAGYKGLKITVPKAAIDIQKFNAVKLNLLERYKVLQPIVDPEYKAQLEDVVIGNMKGFERAADGEKGPELPQVAGGENLEIGLAKGRYMEGLVEGLVGAKAGETKTINVKFPVRSSGPGLAMAGKEAIFEVMVKSINAKVLPEWDDVLAERIKPGLKVDDLEKQVTEAVEGEAKMETDTSRNNELTIALLAISQLSSIPESLVEESVMGKFEEMVTDFKEQGATEEQLNKMMSDEALAKYKEIALPNAEKGVKLGILFRDIAEKENIDVTPAEVQQQVDLVVAQSKQRGEVLPNLNQVREEIMSMLLKNKVFDFLASHADITWVDPLPKTIEPDSPE